MLDTLLNFISEQKLFQPEQKMLLAVSGGIDSIVMTHLFLEANFDFAIAHCNFKLRGDASDQDELMMADFADKHSIRFFTTSFDTAAYANAHQVSIQMAARALRRSWMESLLGQESYDFIATAHHLNDSIETAIFNLAKGTGISGLKGIAPRNDRYIRPMLFASRAMIEEYAKEHNITWREDQSNSSTKYSRNRIRHNVIPELRKINPNLEQTFLISSEKIAAAERIYKEEIRKQKANILTKTDDGFMIDKRKLKSLREGKMVLFEILRDFRFNYHQVEDIFLALDKQSGKQFQADKFQLTIDRHEILIGSIEGETSTKLVVSEGQKVVSTPSGLITLDKIHQKEARFSEDSNIAFIDFDKLRFPLTIRNWEPGDHFRPLGMKHKKKLSDFMIDEKIPLNLKKHVLLLVSGNNVVWVIGHRIDDRFKLTDQTKHVYRICRTIKDDKSI